MVINNRILTVVAISVIFILSCMISYFFVSIIFPDVVYQNVVSNQNQKEVFIYNKDKVNNSIYIAKRENSYKEYDNNLNKLKYDVRNIVLSDPQQAGLILIRIPTKVKIIDLNPQISKVEILEDNRLQGTGFYYSDTSKIFYVKNEYLYIKNEFNKYSLVFLFAIIISALLMYQIITKTVPRRLSPNLRYRE